MATTSISITPQFGNNTVTKIFCGTSSPKLGGTIDISAFPNLTHFRCDGNDITAISEYANRADLQLLTLSNNKITGDIPANLSALTKVTVFRVDNNLLTGTFPNISGMTGLVDFWCGDNNLTGTIPDLAGFPTLREFLCRMNQLTGSIPNNLNSSTSMWYFQADGNYLTGNIPSLAGMSNLKYFHVHNQRGGTRLTGSIPSLAGLSNLLEFLCDINQLTGNIPSLNGLTLLQKFRCNNNDLTGFAGGSVSNTLEQFEAQNNQLTSAAVNAILAAFVAANRTTGTKVLYLGGTGNAAPSYTGGATSTAAGSNFTRSGTTVTANVIGHGHVTGDIVTITGIGPTTPTAPFQGTFVVTRINNNQFQYTTISSGAATGTDTATMRKTSDPTSGYASYQNLALVSRTGGPWDITINQP